MDLRTAATAWHGTSRKNGRLEITTSLDMRFVGQNYELPVILDEAASGLPPLATLRERFFAVHQTKYGHSDETAAIEVVNVRLRARIVEKSVVDPILRAEEIKSAPTTSDVWFEPTGPVKTAIIHRNSLATGAVVSGPAIIMQFDATTVVPPGCSARVDQARNIIIEVSQ
jgi:N-methylhydantoinase A